MYSLGWGAKGTTGFYQSYKYKCMMLKYVDTFIIVIVVEKETENRMHN